MSRRPRPGRWLRRPGSDLGLRLALAGAGAVLLLGPFTVLTLLVVTAWPPLLTLDAHLAATLHAGTSANPAFAGALQLWTDVFAPGPLRVVVGVVAVWLWWRGARRVALWAVVTMVAGGLLGAGCKLLLGRARPEFLDPVSHATGSSFPSGHSVTATLGAGVLLLIFLRFVPDASPVRTQRAARWTVIAAALIVTVVTGLTRVALGVHWLSDVVAGWTLGAAVVAATTAAFAPWRGLPARPSSREPPARRSSREPPARPSSPGPPARRSSREPPARRSSRGTSGRRPSQALPGRRSAAGGDAFNETAHPDA